MLRTMCAALALAEACGRGTLAKGPDDTYIGSAGVLSRGGGEDDGDEGRSCGSDTGVSAGKI